MAQRISRGKRLTTNNEQRATSPGVTANNEQWEICFVGAAGKCDAELDWSMDWSMDLADGAGNGSVGKPRIRAMKALQNLSQAIQECA